MKRQTSFTAGLAFVLIAIAGAGMARSQDLPGNAFAGRQLAEGWCVACHEVAPGLRGPGELNAPAFQDVADDRAVTELALRAFLNTPHFDMPNVVLDPQQIDDVISYILSLRTGGT
jgi:mono/diheme cytochrome c family protein